MYTIGNLQPEDIRDRRYRVTSIVNSRPMLINFAEIVIALLFHMCVYIKSVTKIARRYLWRLKF